MRPPPGKISKTAGGGGGILVRSPHSILFPHAYRNGSLPVAAWARVPFFPKNSGGSTESFRFDPGVGVLWHCGPPGQHLNSGR
jgi:hypothetical protein